MRVPAARAGHAAAELLELGTLGLELESEDEPQVLVAYLPGGALDPSLVVRRLLAAGAASVEPVPVPEVDWVARYREHFRGSSAAGFRILPAWQASARQRRDPRILVVDPGGAFGTGSHETTRLCLGALQRRLTGPQPPACALDLGTGSGILAIAARKLGCPAVVAVDRDPLAADAARRHAALNEVRVQVLCSDLGRALTRRFPLVVANLHAALLSLRRHEITALVSPGGRLVLSGLLAAEAQALSDAYRGLGSVAVSRDGDWAALEVTRTP